MLAADFLKVSSFFGHGSLWVFFKILCMWEMPWELNRRKRERGSTVVKHVVSSLARPTYSTKNPSYYWLVLAKMLQICELLQDNRQSLENLQVLLAELRFQNEWFLVNFKGSQLNWCCTNQQRLRKHYKVGYSCQCCRCIQGKWTTPVHLMLEVFPANLSLSILSRVLVLAFCFGQFEWFMFCSHFLRLWNTSLSFIVHGSWLLKTLVTYA
jgi:hypothetical protein